MNSEKMRNLVGGQNTNWKYIAIVGILSALVLAGVLACQSFLPAETKMPVVPVAKEKPEVVIPVTHFKILRSLKYQYRIIA